MGGQPIDLEGAVDSLHLYFLNVGLFGSPIHNLNLN